VSFEKLLNQILGQRGMLKSGKRQPSKEKGRWGWMLMGILMEQVQVRLHNANLERIANGPH